MCHLLKFNEYRYFCVLLICHQAIEEFLKMFVKCHITSELNIHKLLPSIFSFFIIDHWVELVTLKTCKLKE